MANGYSTLAAIVSEEDNLPHLQADFERAFWRQHTFLDPFVAGVYDYAQVTRSSSYLEKWRECIAEDWVGSYISRLEPSSRRCRHCAGSARCPASSLSSTSTPSASASTPAGATPSAGSASTARCRRTDPDFLLEASLARGFCPTLPLAV